VHMRDQRNARSPERRIVGSARNLGAEFGGEFAMHGRTMHADLLEQTAPHHAHDAAAAGLAGMVGAPPRAAGEASRAAWIERGRRLVFQSLERGTDVIAQAFEPGPGASLALFERRDIHLTSAHFPKFVIHRSTHLSRTSESYGH